MNSKYRIIALLILLAFAVTVCFIMFMPDKIPAHYNIHGEIDRYGSKYESLIMPSAVAAMGFTAVITSLCFRKKEQPQNERFILVSGIVSTAVLNVLNLFILIKATSNSGINGISGIDLTQLTTILLGMLLIVLGNIMPKAKRNKVFGLRTKWSAENDVVWQKSQRVGGYLTVICGMAMLLMGVIFSELVLLIITGGLMLIWVFACIYASYYIYNAVENKNKSDNT